MYKVFLVIGILVCQLAVAGERLVADSVLVDKSERMLYLLRDGVKYQAYPIALGPRPRGHKQHAGDERTPEGRYILDFKTEKSDFYKAIHISYPNEQDIKRALENGASPGGSIMIHGMPSNTPLPPDQMQIFNWTDGCIGVTNEDMDQIWSAIKPGIPIVIVP